MAEQRQVSVQINRQKGKTAEVKFPINSGVYQENDIRIEVSEQPEGGCLLGKLRLKITTEPMNEGSYLTMEKPIRVYLPVEEVPEKVTAMYMFGPWWTRPAFVESFRDIPEHTQIAFFGYKDRCACFVPMVGSKFKTYLTGGTNTQLCMEMTASMGGQSVVDEPLYLYAEGKTVAEAVHKAFTWLADEKGIPLREGRRMPEMFRWLGWCSWDAFRTEVTEEKLRQKADELTEKKIPVKWMLIDDGWFPAQGKMVSGFAPDREKFPNGFRGMIKDIREKGDIRWFGIWHALGGYWDGIAPESALAAEERPYLYEAANGLLLPGPKTGNGFYADWCDLLKREGIDFIKVDGQSAIPLYFENSMPVSDAAKGMNRALESGAYRMDGAIINCMGMAMENILARPVSVVSRNSDDFCPALEDTFTEHLLQNAYNAVYHNEIYCCDWDMFWTNHEQAARHSLLRAVSGGPVYFSDKIGDTVPEVLKPLAYEDGRLLMMDRSAKPTEDCIFSDPRKGGVLKLHNTASWGENRKGGGIAAYNLTGRPQAVTFTAADVPELEDCDQYWVYDWFEKKVSFIGRDEPYTGTLKAEGFAWYIVLPKDRHGTCLGLLNKYAGFSAVESVWESANIQTVVLHEPGLVGWASDKAPQEVKVNALDITVGVKKSGNLYSLPLPVTAGKTVVSVVW